MAEINLYDLSIQELQALSRDIEGELKRRGDEERKKVLAQMKELAASVDMTLEEVIAYSSTKKTKGEPKYQNPENPKQTWTGRGKRPSWIKAALEQGKSLDELRIE
ncbi:MAG: H-NS histone family protein [Candidatus Competibacteraceae bacterium]